MSNCPAPHPGNSLIEKVNNTSPHIYIYICVPYFHNHYISSFVPRVSRSLCCYFKWWGDEKGGAGWVDIIFLFIVFVLLLIVLSWLVHDGCVCLFFSLPSTLKLLCLFWKIISKVKFQIITLWIPLKKCECFDFKYSLGSLPYFMHHN